MRRAGIAARRPPLINPRSQAWRVPMAKDAIVAPELADNFASEKESPYLRFVRSECLAIISTQYVPNPRTVELKTWARKAGKGRFIKPEASRTSTDCYVCDIAPGKKL